MHFGWLVCGVIPLFYVLLSLIDEPKVISIIPMAAKKPIIQLYEKLFRCLKNYSGSLSASSLMRMFGVVITQNLIDSHRQYFGVFMVNHIGSMQQKGEICKLVRQAKIHGGS